MELHRPNNVALGGNDHSYGGLMKTNWEEVPQKHASRGLGRMQSQRSFFQGPKESSFSDVVEKTGSDRRKLMLSSLGTSFRRSIQPRSIEPVEDITETARSTKHFDYYDTNNQENQRIGAFIEEVSPVVSTEDRRSRFSKKVGSSLRKLQGVSFRRTKSSKNIVDETGSADIEEPVDISAEELHISIRSIEEDGGTDTLQRLGWSLRRVNSTREIATDECEKSQERNFSTSEAIEESSESFTEDFSSPIAQEEAIKEQPSKHHDRLHVDMVGETEFCKPPKTSTTTLVDKLTDVDAIKIQPEIVKFCRKSPHVTSNDCNPLPALSEARRANLPEETVGDAVAPLPAIEPSWPTADGVNPFEKVSEALEESSTRKKLSRRKLKRSGSADSSFGHGFRKMLSFRTTDSKQNCSFRESQHERRGIFRFGSRRSFRKSFRLLPGRSKSSNPTFAVNSTSNTGTCTEESKSVELEKPSVRKSKKLAGQSASTPNPRKQEECKTALARIRTKVPMKEGTKRDAVKKAKSLQLEHEGMTKGARLQERKTLMSRLVQRAVSCPTPRQTDDKTAADDVSADFSQLVAPKQKIPKVVVGQDSVSAISSLEFSEADTTPGVVEFKKGDRSTVSSLGGGKTDCIISIAVNKSDNVPSIIGCVETDDLQASSLSFSVYLRFEEKL